MHDKQAEAIAKNAIAQIRETVSFSKSDVGSRGFDTAYSVKARTMDCPPGFVKVIGWVYSFVTDFSDGEPCCFEEKCNHKQTKERQFWICRPFKNEHRAKTVIRSDEILRIEDSVPIYGGKQMLFKNRQEAAQALISYRFDVPISNHLNQVSCKDYTRKGEDHKSEKCGYCQYVKR